MTFSTFTFFAFVAIVFSAYWAARERRWQNLLLLGASYAFYGWWDWRFCGLIAGSSAVDYWVASALGRTPAPGRRRALMATSLIANLGLLGTFKYYGFFAHSLVAAADAVGVHLAPHTLKLVLPVGISFYTFQTLGATIDVYRGRAEPCRDPLDYFAYVSFFPQLVAGPIERFGHLMPQFARPRTFDASKAAAGLRQVLWGLVLKVGLADNLATFVDSCYTESCPGPLLAVATVGFAFQIYWDFAGYSNIAVGTAALLGFSLTRNFAYPYFSRSIAEFWRRWHISLSTWFRDYVYVPLGGSRGTPAQRGGAIFVTFVVSGLWHGAAWNFVVWGVFHGLLAIPSILRARGRPGPTDIPGGEGSGPGLRGGLQMLGTFGLVCGGWVFFRADSLSAALGILTRIGTELFDLSAWSSLQPHRDFLQGVGSICVIVVVVEWLQRRREHALVLEGGPRWARWLLYTLLFWSTVYTMREDPTRFVYFQF